MAAWIDTHVHIDRFAATERAALLERAESAGVLVIGVAADIASSLALAAIEGVRGKVFGVHPLHSETSPTDGLREILADPGALAIGECGFDARGPSYGIQARCFRSQCDLGRELGLPVVLHIDGPGAFAQLSESAEALQGLRVVRHYFTGDATEAEWHRERRHFLSFGNPVRRSPELSRIAASYPADLLLIETDSYPVPGRTTEPKDVVLVGRALASIRNWTVDQTRVRLAENTAAAFGRDAGS